MKVWKHGAMIAAMMLGMVLLSAQVGAAPPVGKGKPLPKPPVVKTPTVALVYGVDADTGVVTVVATSLKQGSAFTDNWAGATKVSTALDGATGNYISTATFLGTPGASQKVTYGITMTAGKSQVSWQGSASLTITP